MKYMLDTNICIYLIRDKNNNILKHLGNTDINNVFISSITESELWFGVYKSKKIEENKLALIKFLSAFKILDFSSEAALQYGKLRVNLEKKGNLIDPMDLLIAAHALAENLILVTNNLKEFSRVRNLKCENWI